MNKKTIFITGAASGIGRATALLFAGRGWFVGLADLNQAGLETLEAEIGSDNCLARVVDVTAVQDFQAAMTGFAEKTGGRLDVMFNNAGVLRMGPNESISLADQHFIVEVNLKAVLTGIHAALPYLKRTPGSRLVTMCSTSAIYGIPELAVYSATKHAIRGLTEALDIELEKYGIVVCDILAPYVNTPMIATAPRQAHSVRSTGINLQPEQIAAMVWKAAHGKKLHWKIHYLTFLLLAVFWAMPFIKRPLVKFLSLTPRK